MGTELADLLQSLSLSEFTPRFEKCSVAELQAMDEDQLKNFLRDLDIPVMARSKLRKALSDKKEAADAASQKSGSSTSAAAGGEELPAGWRSLLDEKSGRSYFWNTVTNEVSWKRPTEAAMFTSFERFVSEKYKAGTVNLKNFELLATLGTGSFGRVRLAKDLASSKFLALKMLRRPRSCA